MTNDEEQVEEESGSEWEPDTGATAETESKTELDKSEPDPPLRTNRILQQRLRSRPRRGGVDPLQPIPRRARGIQPPPPPLDPEVEVINPPVNEPHLRRRRQPPPPLQQEVVEVINLEEDHPVDQIVRPLERAEITDKEEG